MAYLYDSKPTSVWTNYELKFLQTRPKLEIHESFFPW